MEIQEFKEFKSDVEKELRKVLQNTLDNFRQHTGVSIESMSVTLLSTGYAGCMSVTKVETVVHSVKLGVEI